MVDPIDTAIAAAEAPSPRATVNVKLRSGRIVAVNLPVDLTTIEAIDLIGYIATGLPGELEKAKGNAGRPRLLVPVGIARRGN